jgi:hypothetical protein
VIPVFYPAPLPALGEEESRVRLYIDVSGSTRRAWGEVYGMVLHLRAELGEPFYLFSTEVREVSLREMAEGRVETTGGTDFDCVAAPAWWSGFRRLLVITDGMGPLSDGLAQRLKRSGVEVYRVRTLAWGSGGLDRVARQSWMLSQA